MADLTEVVAQAQPRSLGEHLVISSRSTRYQRSEGVVRVDGHVEVRDDHWGPLALDDHGRMRGRIADLERQSDRESKWRIQTWTVEAETHYYTKAPVNAFAMKNNLVLSPTSRRVSSAASSCFRRTALM